MHFRYKLLLLAIISLIFSDKVSGQIDSTYIRPFEQAFSSRVYIVDKFFAFDKENEKDKSKEFTLMTNSPISIGVGASWKSFSFGFSYGIDLFRDKKRGKTKSLEFQHHGYGRKLVYDIILEQHKGFYNERKNKDGSYTLHSDVDLELYGGSFQYVFNNKKFSYKAAFNQNERQIKSAGSFLLGGSLYYSKIRTDSTTLFEGMQKVHENLQIGVSVGYAYTWVFSPKWFATGSITTGATIGNNHPGRFFKERMKIYPIVDGRFAVGYNANKWSLGFSSNISKTFLFFNEDESLSMDNVLLKLTFILRFDWGNKFVNDTLNKAQKTLRM